MIQIETPIIHTSCEDYDIRKLVSILVELTGAELHSIESPPNSRGIITGVIYIPEEKEKADRMLASYE
jgi:hypothetical protein